MTQNCMVGKELLSIELTRYELVLKFSDASLCIGAPIRFQPQSSSSASVVDPEAHGGNIHALWDCIGDSVIEAAFEDTVTLKLRSGTTIAIPPTPGKLRGTFLAKGAFDDGGHIAVDF